MIIRDENLAPWPRTPEIIQASLADYYALISHIDKSVGDLIGTLKKEGLYENTIIVYAADNGLAIGSHRLLGKQNLYEHSMKVPLIHYRNTVRAVRTNEWKMIRYPERDYTQLFNLKNDPLELNNLANQPESQSRVDEMMKLLVDWQRETNDTVSLTANKILPMEYDPESFKQKPDIHQPAYVLKRYFKGEHSGEKVAH